LKAPGIFYLLPPSRTLVQEGGGGLKIGQNLIFVVQMLELYAMKVARTVLRGESLKRTTYLDSATRSFLKNNMVKFHYSRSYEYSYLDMTA